MRARRRAQFRNTQHEVEEPKFFADVKANLNAKTTIKD